MKNIFELNQNLPNHSHIAAIKIYLIVSILEIDGKKKRRIFNKDDDFFLDESIIVNTNDAAV